MHPVVHDDITAADTYDSPITRGKRGFKLGAPKPKSIKLATEGRKSRQKFPSSKSPLSQLGSQRSYPPVTPVTPPPIDPGAIYARTQSDFAYLPDVSVTCSTSNFVVRVKRAFYGLGADAEELELGSSCKSNGVRRPHGDLLFTYPLTACDGVRQLPPGYLVYKFVLHYEPSPRRFPSSAHRLDVDVECRYQRDHHVHQLVVKPTWETVIVRKNLKGRPNEFQIKLMDDSWSRPAESRVYQLGQTVNFQVSAPHLPAGGKLYIKSCYATPPSGESSLKYPIIGNSGCLLDSKRDPGASRFLSRTNKTLRLSLKAFQFTADPDTEVRVHCKFLVTSEEPGPAHKSCTYKGNMWGALTGDDSICECCESQCVTSKTRRAMMEGSASSGPLMVSDQPYTVEDGFLPVSSSLATKMREENNKISRYIDELPESAGIVKDDDDDDDDDGTGRRSSFYGERLRA
ncbi:zona pellucida sperm-binding protein 3-like [Brachyistius frenatus]|uniref:zona pellucida sperm-binding protein 3-like n=1 Tax=Brachyistius frenatus TaxID=100188 RepID=UPI0037E72FBB